MIIIMKLILFCCLRSRIMKGREVQMRRVIYGLKWNQDQCRDDVKQRCPTHSQLATCDKSQFQCGEWLSFPMLDISDKTWLKLDISNLILTFSRNYNPNRSKICHKMYFCVVLNMTLIQYRNTYYHLKKVCEWLDSFAIIVANLENKAMRNCEIYAIPCYPEFWNSGILEFRLTDI